MLHHGPQGFERCASKRSTNGERCIVLFKVTSDAAILRERCTRLPLRQASPAAWSPRYLCIVMTFVRLRGQGLQAKEE